jgi:hypothetical protein
MAFDRAERVVLSGTWLYGGDVPKPVEVVRLAYDYYFELPSDDGRSPWAPYPPNAEGAFYYVRADGGDFLGFPPFATMDAARAWADAQPWAPIVWGIG